MTINVKALLHEQYRRHGISTFVWGSEDCLNWCADCALALTGHDPAHDLRGRYDSEISAKRLMVENGWADMAAVAASFYPECPVAQARSGDWASIVNDDGSDSLGVVVGAFIAVRGKDSLGLLPLGRARRAFRVMA